MNIAYKPRRGYRTIRLPIKEADYFRFVNDIAFARTIVDQLYHEHPELFPAIFAEGYVFNGKTAPSLKLTYQLRRIQLKADGVTFTIAPAFIMPYMTALSDDVEKPLFLRRFNVPYWGLTYLYGRNDMYWYRLEQSLGRFSIVGTTVKEPELLPQDFLADEKHTKRGGDKRRHRLGRRSHTGGLTWSIFEKIRQKYPLLKPRIIHNI